MLRCTPPPQPAAAQVSRPQLTFEQEEELESKDQALGSFLDQLGSAIQGKAVNITPSRVRVRTAGVRCSRHLHVLLYVTTTSRLPSHQQRTALPSTHTPALGVNGSLVAAIAPFLHTQEQLRQQHVPQVQDSSGRLPPDALRELLQLQAQTEGAPLQAAQRLLQK